MAKDRNGNKKSMVSLSLQRGRMIAARYDRMLWWLSLYANALESAAKRGTSHYKHYDYERESLNTELSEYDWYMSGGDLYV